MEEEAITSPESHNLFVLDEQDKKTDFKQNIDGYFI